MNPTFTSFKTRFPFIIFFIRRYLLCFIIFWILFFLLGTLIPREFRDRFFETQKFVDLSERLRGACWLSEIFAAIIVMPITLIYVLIKERKFLKTISSFLASAFIIFLILFSLEKMRTTFSQLLNPPISYYLMTPMERNSTIVKLESIILEGYDQNNNRIGDTIKVHMTLNGINNENRMPSGLYAFGGLDLCLKSASGNSTIVCKHFFHAENQNQLGQDRLKVGAGKQTFIFSLEIPKDVNISSYKNTKNLQVTALFIGADNLLLEYKTILPNRINISDFEKIGIQKLSNESGLH